MLGIPKLWLHYYVQIVAENKFSQAHYKQSLIKISRPNSLLNTLYDCHKCRRRLDGRKTEKTWKEDMEDQATVRRMNIKWASLGFVLSLSSPPEEGKYTGHCEGFMKMVTLKKTGRAAEPSGKRKTRRTSLVGAVWPELQAAHQRTGSQPSVIRWHCTIGPRCGIDWRDRT